MTQPKGLGTSRVRLGMGRQGEGDFEAWPPGRSSHSGTAFVLINRIKVLNGMFRVTER